MQKEVASLRTEVANLKSLEAVASEDEALCKRKVNDLENALSVKEAAWKQKEEALVWFSYFIYFAYILEKN